MKVKVKFKTIFCSENSLDVKLRFMLTNIILNFKINR